MMELLAVQLANEWRRLLMLPRRQEMLQRRLVLFMWMKARYEGG